MVKFKSHEIDPHKDETPNSLEPVERFFEPQTYHRTDFTMNDNTQPVTTAIPGFAIPPGARAVLVTDAGEGNFTLHPVEHGKSMLNIRTELLDHLNAYPHTDAWLEDLRDYCASRIAARGESRATGGVVIPRQHGRWEIVHAQMFQPVGAA